MTTVDITIDAADEGKDDVIRLKIARALRSKHLAIKSFNYTLLKRAIDARHGKVRLFMRCQVFSCKGNAATDTAIAHPASPAPCPPFHALSPSSPKVVIVGTGPAAIFAALTLLKHGIRLIMAERGERTTERKLDIAAISTKGIVDEDSNYCFGEGGAGTFSDGKLFTRSGKRGSTEAVLKELVAAGADERILTDGHPHIGTDRLPAVVNALIKKIIDYGGECRFHTRCTSLIIEGGRVKGIITKDTHTGKTDEIRGDAVLLATGHSATDIYDMLYKAAPASLAAKGFAVGVRVEHPRELIDSIQYHLPLNPRRLSPAASLGAAEYRLTSQVPSSDGIIRGVYSFCMCPGGFVVPSATGPREIVINGMSSSKRNSQWSNSAIVMEVRTEDLSALYKEMVADRPSIHPLLPQWALGDRPSIHRLSAALGNVTSTPPSPLLGLAWRTQLEGETYLHGDGQKAPAQRLIDFLSHKDSASLPRSSYTPGITSSRLDEWLPKPLVQRLSAAFKVFDSKMRGFITEDAILIAGETRTSSSVRILRAESMECPALPGLYAAGEGAGYAGGIASSAFDGIKAGEKIAEHLHTQP